jgi:high-affinity K+ transport system ATPase subunit B
MKVADHPRSVPPHEDAGQQKGYRPLGAAALLRRNLVVYGAGGVVAPFVAIKAIDVVVGALGLA